MANDDTTDPQEPVELALDETPAPVSDLPEIRIQEEPVTPSAPPPISAIVATPSEPALPTSVPAVQIPITPEERRVGFLTQLSNRIAQDKIGGVSVRFLRLDPDQRGGELLLSAADVSLARRAASALIYGDDGREWKYIGDGPDGEDGLYCAHIHVSPLT